MRPIYKKILLLTLCASLTIIYGCKSELIGDIEQLEQNHTPYSNSIKENQKRHIPKSIHKIIDKNYNKKFFKPWKLSKKYAKKNDIL